MIQTKLQAQKVKINKSYQELSLDSGISATTLHGFLSGKHDTTLAKAEDIARALGFEIVLKKIK